MTVYLNIWLSENICVIEMKVRDVMVRNVIHVSPNDTISVALSKIRKHNISQLPVIDGDKYVGMLTLKNIVTKNIDPAKTKCSDYIVNTPNLKSGDDLEGAITLLLNSGLRALPVIDDKIVGIISETDIIGVVDKLSKNILSKQIGNIATECEFVAKKDKAGTARNLMLSKNISRVPVIEGNKIIGVVTQLDLARLLEGKGTLEVRGGKLQELGVKEKLNIGETPVESIMSPPVILSGNSSVKDTIISLRNNDAILVSNGTVKIVTPKDIIELMVGGPAREIHVQIIGVEDESPLFKAKIDQAVAEFMRKMEKMVEDIQYLFVHVEKHHKGGGRQKYSIRARFGTPIGLFVAKSWGWNPINVSQEVMNNLEREVIHKYGKHKTNIKKKRLLSKRR